MISLLIFNLHVVKNVFQYKNTQTCFIHIRFHIYFVVKNVQRENMMMKNAKKSVTKSKKRQLSTVKREIGQEESPDWLPKENITVLT